MLLMMSIGLLIGLALALTGGGGSLIAIPLLVYLLNIPLQVAIPLSLLVVATAAFIGAFDAYRHKLLFLRPILIYAIATSVFSVVGISLGNTVPELLRMQLFSGLMLIISLKMLIPIVKNNVVILRAKLGESQHAPICRFSDTHSHWEFKYGSICALMLILAGVITGVLTGFFGVGGGFLIVPVLMWLTQMTIQTAVANSLAIIAIMGISSAITQYKIIFSYPEMTIILITMAILGMLIGRYIATLLSAKLLQGTFGISVLLIAISILIQN